MADPSLFKGPDSEVPATPSEQEELPDRLRVHSLARVLGTTSRRVLDALTELDGRTRSAHSSVDRVEAVRVRDLLDSVAEPAVGGLFQEAGGAEATAEVPDEPESRLLLETAPEPVAVRADYMPLFVAPQPVAFERAVPRDVGVDTDDDSDDYGDDDLGGADADTDDENGDRPANRRRRRGRRGRGRGRGSEGAAADDADDDETEDDGSAAESEEAGDPEDAEDATDEEGGSAEDAGGRRRRRRRRRKDGRSARQDQPVSQERPRHR